MSVINSSFDGLALTLALAGAIDTKNASAVEAEISTERAAHPNASLVLDFSELTYISSAGLRVMLRLKKALGGLSIINVSPDVYGIFEMTGFTMMIDVRKAYANFSVEGCPIIGEGAKGVLYRIDDDTVCKVYRDPDSLDDIHRERELAKTAFVAGVPTAISYDVVRVGDGYGSIFELLNAKTVSDLMASGEWSVERAAAEMADLLAVLGQTKAESELIPSVKRTALRWTNRLEGVLDEGSLDRARELIEDVPDEPHLVHGDFHIRNVMVQDDEPLLIDLDTLTHGNNIFDLGISYSTHVGRGLLDPEKSGRFLGIPWDLSCQLWTLMLRDRFPEASKGELAAIEDKARLISALRLMGRPITHPDIDARLAQRTFELYGGIIAEVLPRIDSLAI